MQQKDVQKKGIQEAVKQAYKKPKFSRVSLVADRVLKSCGSDDSCNYESAFVATFGSA
jgi:hypothetical protein